MPLVTELYRFSDAREGDLVSGVEILRCEECAGSFVSRASAYLLLDRAREPRLPTVWDALVGWLMQITKATPVR